ncbi:MAG: LEA type 2 family protein [Candidatus Kapaibacterium sp.]|jgi:hypothetical protein
MNFSRSKLSGTSYLRSTQHSAVLIVGLSLGLLLNGCGSIKTISDALSGLRRCEFKLASVSDAKLAGIQLGEKARIGDFKPFSEGIELLQAFRNKQFDFECIVNVEVRNPNTGTEGSRKADATIKRIDYRLYIDDRVAVSGDIAQPLVVPSNGQSVIMPVSLKFDIFSVYRDKTYDEILNLVLAIAGAQGSAARLTLDIRPTIDTPLGELTYPNRIKVFNKEFRN